MNVEKDISDRGGRSPDNDTVEQINLMIQKNVKGFTQAHSDTTAEKGCASRKLIVDEVKSISIEEIELQMLDTTNIVTTLDELKLAPQTKQFMRWAETGTVETLLALPGRPISARSLFQVTENDQIGFQRNLTSKPTGSDDIFPANIPQKYGEIETILSPNFLEEKRTQTCKLEKCEMKYRRKTNHHCLVCSHLTKLLDNHMKSDHEQTHVSHAEQLFNQMESNSSASAKSVMEMDSSKIPLKEEEEQEETKKDLNKKFGLRDFYPKPAQLEGSDEHTDFMNSNTNGLRKRKLESEDTNCASQIDGLTKAVHIGRARPREPSKTTPAQSSAPKVQKKIQVMSNRIKLIAEKSLKKIVCLKENCHKNIREKTREKIESEIDLRINQCKAIELKLSLFEVDCKGIKGKTDNLTSIEEMIKKLERVVDGMVLELQVLWKEEEELAKNVEKAESSYHIIVEELDALKFQLQSHKANLN